LSPSAIRAPSVGESILRRRHVASGGLRQGQQVGGREGDSFLSPELQREQIFAVAVREGLEVAEVLKELDAAGGDAARAAMERGDPQSRGPGRSAASKPAEAKARLPERGSNPVLLNTRECDRTLDPDAVRPDLAIKVEHDLVDPDSRASILLVGDAEIDLEISVLAE
jgi:hypothetical protein